MVAYTISIVACFALSAGFVCWLIRHEKNQEVEKIRKRRTEVERFKQKFQTTFSALKDPFRSNELDELEVRILYAVFLSEGLRLSMDEELPFVLDTPDEPLARAVLGRSLRKLGIGGMLLILWRRGKVWSTDKGQEYVIENIA